jgi:nicotinamide riboside kinase
MEKPLRIAIVGPESTGKSILTRELAKHFQAPFVPEFAREYLEQLGRKYTYEDVLYIAEQQLLLEKKAEQSVQGPYIFYDTTLLTIRIWFDVVFGKVPESIVKAMEEDIFDIYLLMDIDMPWEPDPLREHPHFRKELLQLHINELKRMGAKYYIISGTGITRTESALKIFTVLDIG